MGLSNHELHDKDFYAWTKKTAQLLKEGKILKFNSSARIIHLNLLGGQRVFVRCTD